MTPEIAQIIESYMLRVYNMDGIRQWDKYSANIYVRIFCKSGSIKMVHADIGGTSIVLTMTPVECLREIPK